MHSLALPLFTLLVQAAIGMTIAFTFMQAQTQATERDMGSALKTLFVICGFASIGLLLSTTHLGYPLNAMYALTHIKTSWLSREILLSSAFLAMVGFAFLGILFKKKLIMPLLYAGIVLGLLDVYCMAAIYKAASVATWDFAHNFTSFFGMVINAFCCFALVCYRKQLSSSAIQKIVILCLVALFIRGFTQADMLMNLDQKVAELGVMFPSQAQQPFYSTISWLIGAWVAACVGALSFVYYAFSCSSSNENCAKSGYVWIGMIALMVFELITRFHFYHIA